MTAEVAIPHPPKSPARRTASLQDKITYAAELANSGLLPAAYRRHPANVLYAIEYGEMLGLSPMAAINGIHVIEGKPTASSALMSALVRKAGHRLRVTGDDSRAVCEIVRADDPEFVFRSVWTVERAQQAGLLGKDVWKRYRASMLKARAISECARDACEEALMGMHYTAEELGASVDEDERPTARPAAQIVTVEDITGEPDWGALINQHERAHEWQKLRDLWTHAREMRPNDSALLERIVQAGERVKAALEPQQDAQPVDAEVVNEPDAAEVKKRERRMFALLNEAGVGGSKADERARRLRLLALILDRDITSSSDLSHDDRGLVVTELEVWKQQGRLVENAAAALDDGSEDGGIR
ncbi:hypothetical protein ACFQE5_01565 [Pseudonocardia hispaniensis]|uniref:RecT family protein n=1 Tax=Pseudonocardia hispaniensis TaxID=904933 RepID=A0ABW1IWM7_9PSEU